MLVPFHIQLVQYEELSGLYSSEMSTHELPMTDPLNFPYHNLPFF